MPNREHGVDPYFQERLEKAKQHRILGSVEIDPDKQENVESNKELPHPTVEEDIEAIGWSEKAVVNFIHAFESNAIDVERLDDNRIRITFLPLTDLPEEFGHVSELATVDRNVKSGPIFGSTDPEQFTYLQSVDFAVEGYMDDEEDGKMYGRLYVRSDAVREVRNVYLDPESILATDYEYGFSFIVRGGIPLKAISKIDVIRAKRIPHEESTFATKAQEWVGDTASYIEEQGRRLREYLDVKRSAT